MSQVRILTDAAEIVLTIIFWLGFLFAIVVGTFWKWWKTEFGNSYMLKTLSLSVVCTGIALREMFDIDLEALWFRWLILIALSTIPVILIWRGWVLWKEQRAGKSLNPVIAVRDWARRRRAAAEEHGRERSGARSV